eukprot:TRINITY_DN22422_c0_g1_i1.p1 TRINITY_DN22422_c0_g1~~TRINITY_DN22422_c0_g1_i1.p1  ORF type:complete len:477 (-),score=47.96 TRINITY_DN22422_c0_g1_i1:198-1502(-)
MAEAERPSTVCRYCFEAGTPSRPLISPCLCRGSVGTVHSSCLKKWVASKPSSVRDRFGQEEQAVCEICNSPYATRAAPTWKRAVEGCWCVLVTTLANGRFHAGMICGSVALFMLPSSMTTYVGTISMAMVVFSFASFAFICCTASAGGAKLDSGQLIEMEYVKNVFFPVCLALLVLEWTLQLWMSDGEQQRNECLTKSMLYCVILVASILFAVTLRVHDDDTGVPRCRFYVTVCWVGLQDAYLTVSWEDVISGNYIATWQVLVSGIHFVMSFTVFDVNDKLLILLDALYGILWAISLVSMLVSVSCNGAVGRMRFVPQQVSSQRVAQCSWIAVAIVQITSIHWSVSDTHASFTELNKLHVCTWIVLDALVWCVYLVLYAPTWGDAVSELGESLAWAFRARTEFCTSPCGGVDAETSDTTSGSLRRPLVAAAARC